MPVPTWLSAFGHFASDVLGSALGISIVEGGARQKFEKAFEGLGKVVRDRFQVKEEDREEVMKELIRLQEEAEGNIAALIALLKRMEPQGFIRVNRPDDRGRPRRRFYFEARLVNLLLGVDPPDRQWVYPYLSGVLERDQAEFWAWLDIMDDDGWHQILMVAREIARETGAPIAEAFGTAFRAALSASRTAAVGVDRAAERLANRLEPLAERFETFVDRAEARWLGR